MNFYIWRDRVVGSLLGLADTAYQRSAWSGAIDSSDKSPDEMLVTLLDDWAFASFLVDNREQFNDSQAQRVELLLRAIFHYQKTESDYDGDVERVLTSTAWRDIVIKARNLYIALCPDDRTI